MGQKKFFLGVYLFLSSFFYSCEKDALEIIKPDYPDNVIDNPYKDNNFLRLNDAPCVVDLSNKTVFYPVNEENLSNFSPLVEYNSTNSKNLKINGEIVKNNSVFDFGNINSKKTTEIEYIVDGEEIKFKLIFTTLPIIELYGDEEIKDYPKLPHRFKIHDPNFRENKMLNQCTEFVAGIETRGHFSQSFDKKSFAVEFWKSFSIKEGVDVSLFDLRNDDDWILDAMFVDKARMRNKVSMEVWSEFGPLSYQDKEPKAKNYIRGEYVELFLNGKYHGLYHFTEKIDRKQLKLNNDVSPKDGGLLYKSTTWEAPAFESYVDFDNSHHHWHGFEQKFPDHLDHISWNKIYTGVKLIVDGDSREIMDNFGDYFDLDNLVDCFIFINLLYGTDNTGKNMYFAKYMEKDPFFLVPWDLDATWGSAFDGDNNVPFDKVTSNNLFNTLRRLEPAFYLEKLVKRWGYLRQSIVTPQRIIEKFKKQEKILLESGAFEREQDRWGSPSTELNDQINLIENWVENRFNFLDSYLNLTNLKRELNP